MKKKMPKLSLSFVCIAHKVFWAVPIQFKRENIRLEHIVNLLLMSKKVSICCAPSAFWSFAIAYGLEKQPEAPVFA